MKDKMRGMENTAEENDMMSARNHSNLRCSKLEDIVSSGVYDPWLQYHFEIRDLKG